LNCLVDSENGFAEAGLDRFAIAGGKALTEATKNAAKPLVLERLRVLASRFDGALQRRKMLP